MKNKIIDTIIILWAILITLYICNSILNNIKLNEVRQRMFSAKKADLANINLSLDLESKDKDKVNLIKEFSKEELNKFFIVFFSPKCEACIQELEMLNLLIKKNILKKEPILIGIGKYEEIKEFLKNKDIDFSYYSINQREYKENIKVNAVPLTLLVDKKGKILFVKTGWSNDKIFIDSFVEKINSYN